jgi:nitrate/nitrite transport system substrate-binding protein
MWMRYWLAAGGIIPDKDGSLITDPARADGRQHESRQDGRLLRRRAVEQPRHRDGIGFTLSTTQQMWKDHPEKVCAVTEEFTLRTRRRCRRC